MKVNKLRMLASQKGFTLIELMIVIAIIGILAAVAIPNFIAYRDKSYCSAAESDANGIAGTMADYFAIPTHITVDASTIDLNAPFDGNTKVKDIKFPALSGKNSATIRGGVSNIRITVTDGSGRCPSDYMVAGKANGWDAANKTFTKAMK